MLHKIISSLLIVLSLALFCLAFSPSPKQTTNYNSSNGYCFLGEIRMFGGNFAPRGWVLCEGQVLSISENSHLFSLIGKVYGGDGRSTFALPDLRARVAIGAGNDLELIPKPRGQYGGTNSYVYNDNSYTTAHKHTGLASFPVIPLSNKGSYTKGNNSLLAVGNKPTSNLETSIRLNPSGLGQGQQTNIDLKQPYTVTNYIICTHHY